MDYGAPFRLVKEDAATSTLVPQGCKLLGFYCASVGASGLPTDPPPPPEPLGPMTITDVAPMTGPDGTEVAITGTNFGEQDATCKVLLGTDLMTILSWEPDMIVFLAEQGAMVSGAGHPITVQRDDGEELLAPAPFGFTFQDADGLDRGAGTEGSDPVPAAPKKGKKKKGHKDERQDDDERQGRDGDPGIGSHAFPTFDSGAGIMLQEIGGAHIMIGPLEMKAGQWYPISMLCPNGLEVVSEGSLDVTFMIAR